MGPFMKFRHILFGLLSLATVNSFADALSAVPLRVGPVSHYGALHTSGGKVIGAKNNQEAQVRGISLFWSDATGRPYYSKDAIRWAVDNLKIDVFRFAMTVDQYKGDTSDPVATSYAYVSSPDANYTLIDKMVEAAIENDIYIIIDWHSHRADNSTETAAAKTFFSYISKKYANVPNIIYEIYNEPITSSWDPVKKYANTIVPLIRANTTPHSNLILVGTPFYSQMGGYGGVNGSNIAYVLHFYAGSHSSGTYGSRATKAMSDGNAVFISEWGTTNADGKGDPDENATKSWIEFMDNNKISNCNWSFRHTGTNETSAMFQSTSALSSRAQLEAATFSKSGTLVKNYLTSHARNWNDSLTKGHRSGSCAITHQYSNEDQQTLNSVLKSGCSYKSSNEKVVSISGSSIQINGAGYAILTGSDNSQSVVTITPLTDQSISKFKDLRCNYGATCSSGIAANFSGSSTQFEWVLGSSMKTVEGATYTLKSLNPDIVDVKKAICQVEACYSNKNKLSYMYDFKSIGIAKIVATAPAVTGYKALQDTITVTFNKGLVNPGSKFKDYAVATGATIQGVLPEYSQFNTKINYTYNKRESTPYLTRSGKDIIAGQQDAIVYITATSPETEYIQAFEKTIRIVIGDSLKAVNMDEAKEIAAGVHDVAKSSRNNFNVTMSSNGFSLQILNSMPTSVQLFDMKGQKIWSAMQNFEKGTHNISLDNVRAGHYILMIQQGSNRQTFRWNRK